MPVFPTNKTVPLDKDIGVSLPKTTGGTGARQDLSQVLENFDDGLQQEILDRQTADSALNQAITDHIADGTDAHDASAISVVPSGNQSSNNAQSAIDELQTDIDTRATAANLSAETSARQAADTILQNEVDGERAPLRVTVAGVTATIGAAKANRIKSDGSNGSVIALVNGALVSDYAGGTINFSTGVITGGGTDFIPIDFTGQANKWAKYGLVLLPGTPNTVLVLPAVGFGTTAANAPDPAIDGGIPIGVIAVQDNGTASQGTILNLVQTSTTQFAASGAGSGGSGSGSPLDPDQESTFLYYTRSDFAVDKKKFILFTDGSDQILGLKKIVFTTATQFMQTIDLTGPQVRKDATPILSAVAKLRYNIGKVDAPTVHMTRDGQTWIQATVEPLASESDILTARVDFGPPTRVYDSSLLSNTTTLDDHITAQTFASTIVFDNQALRQGRKFTVSSTTTILSATVQLSKTGHAVADTLQVQIIKDNGAGLPSTVGGDVLASMSYDMTNGTILPIGNNQLFTSTFSSPVVLATGTYHLVLRTGSGAAYAGLGWDTSNEILTNAREHFTAGIWVSDNGNTHFSKLTVQQGGEEVTGFKIAAMLTPTYRTTVSSMEMFLGTTSIAGTVVGKIMTVASGVPQTLLATSGETFVAGQDITSTKQWKTFSFKPVTLESGTQYALVVEGTGLTTQLATTTTADPDAFNTGNALYVSGWTPDARKLLYRVTGTGCNLKLQVICNVPNSELLGFGVDYCQDLPVTIAGEASFEERIITSTEATTGLVSLNCVRYTPGTHQLEVLLNGHVWMAPDFTEMSPSQVQFPAGFFQPGDTVRFAVAFGLVDSTSQSLSKIAAMYDAIVGSSAQVAAGVASHTSLNSALAAIPTDGKILYLSGVTESVNINKRCMIEGRGYGSNFGGLVAINTDFCILKNVRFGANLTIAGNGCFIKECFASSTSVILDVGTANQKEYIQE